MKLLISLACVFSFYTLYGQDPIYNHSPRVADRPSFQKEFEYEWPFWMDTPPYIGIIGGWEGFQSNYYQVGLAVNGLRMDESWVGGMIGGNLLYKRHFTENITSYEAEIGMFYYVALGLNFNYHVQNDNSTFGVRPFVGISLYHMQLIYGYNMFSNKTNKIDPLRHGTLEFRFVIPVIPFKGKEKRLTADYPYYYPGAYNNFNYSSNSRIKF